MLTHHGRLQVHKYGPRHMAARAACVEKGVEGVLTGVGQRNHILHHTVRPHSMFQTEELPTCIASLNASLANMD